MTDNLNKSYMSYVFIWIILLCLTALTVFCSTLQLGHPAIWIALTIATIKGSLVLLFFMHLKDEQSFIKYAFLVALIVLAIFIGLTFFDVLYR
ncbi:MAG: cytochrome C oxidase subunit IV family protein [Candidatus Riflebacteria bacterium]|nr:cytochrome C oxidase subunit IV family protein [Candidatus Riflebacteria bacterium]